eukprot:1138818-Pelagomonas_calceolata.AAC.15
MVDGRQGCSLQAPFKRLIHVRACILCMTSHPACASAQSRLRWAMISWPSKLGYCGGCQPTCPVIRGLAAPEDALTTLEMSLTCCLHSKS